MQGEASWLVPCERGEQARYSPLLTSGQLANPLVNRKGKSSPARSGACISTNRSISICLMPHTNLLENDLLLLDSKESAGRRQNCGHFACVRGTNYSSPDVWGKNDKSFERTSGAS